MAPQRPARSGLIAIVPAARHTAVWCCSAILAIGMAVLVVSPTLADPAVSEKVPLPVPAPLPKTGSAPPSASAPSLKTGSAPPAAPAKSSAETRPSDSRPAESHPAETRQTPSLFPFSALFGNKSSTASTPPKAPEPPSPFDTKQRALLDRISAYLSSVQTMVGKFVQVGPDGGRTEGTFYMQKPGRIRFQYNPPSPIDIISDGSSVVVRDRKLATQDLYPLSQTPLRYLLAEHIDLLRDTDVVSVTADDSFATVVIEQKQLFVGTDRLMIMFDAKDLTLKQWTVTDPQGFDTTVAVYNLDSSKKPDPNLFVINYQREQTGVQ
jgi:outer membrane lipoprotein-sorting protein